MFLLLLACAGETTTPSDKAAPLDTEPAATDSDSKPPDSPVDTQADDSAAPTDSAPDSEHSEDSPVDTGGDSEEIGWRSVLYPKDWTPGFAVDGAFLHDFSYAGYHNGEDPLPTPTITQNGPAWPSAAATWSPSTAEAPELRRMALSVSPPPNRKSTPQSV